MSETSFKKGLGRGLSSLLGDTSSQVQSNKIPIKDLIRNQFQPRKNFNKENLEELTNSIREQGVIQPIVVRPDKLNSGKYEIVAGERRWLAAQNAGLHVESTDSGANLSLADNAGSVVLTGASGDLYIETGGSASTAGSAATAARAR